MNDFAFGNETKNCVPACHDESTNSLCTKPVRRALDAGFRSYRCDVRALSSQNAFDGHRLLPWCGLAAISDATMPKWCVAVVENCVVEVLGGS